MKKVLVVDDEKSFLLSLTDGLTKYSSEFVVVTAENGKVAANILGKERVDLVITDLQMSVMDGFQLLAFMKNRCPEVPAIVMTAFGTPAIEKRITDYGSVQYLEKPLNINQLTAKIREGLNTDKKGYINGITLSSFLQVIELERHTCTLTIKSTARKGYLYIMLGKLTDAKCGDKRGKNAAIEVISWDDVEIEIVNACARRKKVIDQSISQVIMEASLYRDTGETENEDVDDDDDEVESKLDTKKDILLMEKMTMSIKEKLQEFTSIDGFAGVALFTPHGEPITMIEAQGSDFNLQKIGVLANNTLINAQKASLDMGTGRGQLVHVVAESANIIIRCLNEGNHPLESEPGKAHIHLVLILRDDSSLGLAKLKVNMVIESLAPDLRG